MFTFFGWKFDVREAEHPCVIGTMVYIRLWKKLINPEAPGLIHSFSQYVKEDRYISPDLGILQLKLSCAWLIAHWWEHALDICPCQHGIHDDEKGSTFRNHLINSLMSYDAAGLS